MWHIRCAFNWTSSELYVFAFLSVKLERGVFLHGAGAGKIRILDFY